MDAIEFFGKVVNNSELFEFMSHVVNHYKITTTLQPYDEEFSDKIYLVSVTDIETKQTIMYVEVAQGKVHFLYEVIKGAWAVMQGGTPLDI